MRRNPIVIFIFIVVLLCPALSAEALPNGDFSINDGSLPEHWTLYNGAEYVREGVAMPKSLVQNGDFETRDGNWVEGWNSTLSAYTSISEERTHSGNTAVRISGHPTGGTPSVYRRIDNVPPGEYTFSAYVYMDGTIVENKGAEIYCEFYDGDGTYFAVDHIFGMTSSYTWQKLSVTMPVPENTGYIEVGIKMHEPASTVYADDVYFAPVRAENKYTLKTDETFYYHDMESMIATAEGDITAADFTVKHLGKTVKTYENVCGDGGRAQCIIPLSLLTELKNEYIIEAKLYKDSVVVKTLSASVYKYLRPSKLTKDGLYMKEGKVFHPVFAYHVYNQDENRVGEIGVNVVEVQGPSVEYVLNKLDSLNMLGIMGMVNHWDFALDMIEAIKDHPALFGYAVMDEPFFATNLTQMEEWIFNSYKMIRDVDDKNPVFICQGIPLYYDFAARYADILACDPYPYGEDTGKTTIQSNMAKAATKSGKPMYTIVQTFTPSGGTVPESDHVRAQIHRAFAAGAQGVGFYSISDAQSPGPLYEVEETWAGMGVFAENELPQLFACYAENACTPLFLRGDKADVRSVLTDCFLTDAGQMLLFVHNRSKSTYKDSIQLTDTNISLTGFTGEAHDGTLVSGTTSLAVELAPGEAGFWMLTPTGLIVQEAKVQHRIQAKNNVVYTNVQGTTVQGAENAYVSLPKLGAGLRTKTDGLVGGNSYVLKIGYKGTVEEAFQLSVNFFNRNAGGFQRWKDFCAESGRIFIEGESIYTEKFGKAGEEWQILTLDFYVPQDANAAQFTVEMIKEDADAAICLMQLEKCAIGNLVKNGSFSSFVSENKLSGGWYGYYPEVSCEFSADGYIQLQGGENGNSARVRQKVYLQNDTAYKLQFRYKNEIASVQPEVGIFTRYEDGELIDEWYKEENGQFQTYTAYFKVKDAGEYVLWIGYRNTKGVYSFDDISLVPHKLPGIYAPSGTTYGTGVTTFVGVDGEAPEYVVFATPHGCDAGYLTFYYEKNNIKELLGVVPWIPDADSKMSLTGMKLPASYSAYLFGYTDMAHMTKEKLR